MFILIAKLKLCHVPYRPLLFYRRPELGEADKEVEGDFEQDTQHLPDDFQGAHNRVFGVQLDRVYTVPRIIVVFGYLVHCSRPSFIDLSRSVHRCSQAYFRGDFNGCPGFLPCKNDTLPTSTQRIDSALSYDSSSLANLASTSSTGSRAINFSNVFGVNYLVRFATIMMAGRCRRFSWVLPVLIAAAFDSFPPPIR